MSWLFSLIKKNENIKYNKTAIRSVHPPAKYSIDNSRLYLAAGGLDQTCISNINGSFKEKTTNQYVILGLGIKQKGDQFNFIKQKDWETILSDEVVNIYSLNDHFVTFLIQKDNIIIRNDQLGLRCLYYLKTKDFRDLNKIRLAYKA